MKPTYHTANYRVDVLENHLDNPLITGMPSRFSPANAHQRLKAIPVIPAIELTSANKLELLTSLEKRIHIPTKHHLDFYIHIYARMVAGYESRNPLLPEVIEWTLDAADEHPVFTLDDENDTTSIGTSIIGKSGTGKTSTIVSVFRRLFPQCIQHTKDNFQDIQITYLIFDMPYDGDTRSLCLNFFKALDNALNQSDSHESYYSHYSKTKLKAHDMLQKIHFLCRRNHVGILVIDELQNLLVQPPKKRQLMLSFLDSLTNQSHVPIVKIGTSDALHLFKAKKRNIRRKGVTFEITPYSESNKYWIQLVDTLFSFQLASKSLPDTKKNRDFLYELTQGYPYAVLYLWRELQIDAVNKGSKLREITHKSIDDIWKRRFPLLRTVFRAIKHHSTAGLSDLLDAQHFLDTGYFDQAIKHLKRMSNDPNIKGRSAEEIASSIDVMIDEVDLDVKQQEKIQKVKQNLHNKVRRLKAGQTYSEEDGV